MSIERVAVTGGSGRIGREIIDVLDTAGYHTINLDRRRPEERRADEFVRVDLLDAGQTTAALSQWAADAVIHMGTIPSPSRDPGHVTYENNVVTTYNVLEAAETNGVETVTLASSVNAHGWTFQDAPPRVEYLPIDEDHPVSPRDPYGLGKYVMEVTADGFARRDGPPHQIASLRISSAHTDDVLRSFATQHPTIEDLKDEYAPGDNPTFRYLHVRDVASLARASIEGTFDGHEVFWAVATDTTVDVSTEQLLEAFYPETEIRQPLTGTDGLFDVSKAEDLLGWTPAHSWRDLSE